MIKIFVERLNQIREKSKYTNQQICEGTGLSVRAIQFYLSGERDPKIDSLMVLCKFFNVSSDYLLGIVDEPEQINFKHDNFIDNIFGSRLKELRKENDLTQIQLAEKLNVSRRMVQIYEAGEKEPTLSKLLSLSEIFNVSLDYLVGKTNIK